MLDDKVVARRRGLALEVGGWDLSRRASDEPRLHTRVLGAPSGDKAARPKSVDHRHQHVVDVSDSFEAAGRAKSAIEAEAQGLSIEVSDFRCDGEVPSQPQLVTGLMHLNCSLEACYAEDSSSSRAHEGLSGRRDRASACMDGVVEIENSSS